MYNRYDNINKFITDIDKLKMDKYGTLFSDNNAYGTRPILFTLNEHRKIRCVPHFGVRKVYIIIYQAITKSIIL